MSSLFVFSPSPDDLRNPGLVDVVHWVSGRSRIAPGNCLKAAGGVGTRPSELGVDPGQDGMRSPG